MFDTILFPRPGKNPLIDILVFLWLSSNLNRPSHQSGLSSFFFPGFHSNIRAHGYGRDLVGLALRLCIKLRYHRKITGSSDTPRTGPYTIELQKRFFWCAYCFDRFVPRVSHGLRGLEW